jgi:hypothetical protein
MSIDSVMYLLAIYWPYMTAAVLIGAAVGWFSYVRPKS